MSKVVVGPIASVTDLAKLNEKANGNPHLGFTKSGQIYILENGSHKVIQAQDAIEKTGIDHEYLSKLIANGGVVEDAQGDDVDEEVNEETPEEVTEEVPVVEEKEVKEEVHEEAQNDEEVETELNPSRRVLKRISKIEDLLLKAAEQISILKNEITQ